MQPVSRNISFKTKDLKHTHTHPCLYAHLPKKKKNEDSGAAMTFAKHLPARNQKCRG